MSRPLSFERTVLICTRFRVSVLRLHSFENATGSPVPLPPACVWAVAAIRERIQDAVFYAARADIDAGM
jgi:hypothetical protein